jgi:hypothetical protein
MDKLQYTKDKILSRLQNEIAFSRLNEIKLFLNKIPNLGMVNYVSDSFHSSNVGWLTASKIIENIIASNENLTLDNFEKRYMSLEHNSDIRRKMDIIDDNIIEEDLADKLQRILSEHGEMDLTDSFDIEDLNEDGLRSRNLINKNATSLDGVDIIDISEESLPVLKLNKGDLIKSPFSGTEEVYQLDNETFIDLETDKEFKIKYI